MKRRSAQMMDVCIGSWSTTAMPYASVPDQSARSHELTRGLTRRACIIRAHWREPSASPCLAVSLLQAKLLPNLTTPRKSPMSKPWERRPAWHRLRILRPRTFSGWAMPNRNIAKMRWPIVKSCADFISHFHERGFKLDLPPNRMTVITLKDAASYRALLRARNGCLRRRPL